MKGRIIDTRPIIRNKKLRIIASIETDEGNVSEAFMPDREVSVILPCSLLTGDKKCVTTTLLKTIESILKRMVNGRKVRIWEYQDRLYFSFLSWRQVTFDDTA
jgi:hypothetical protein